MTNTIVDKNYNDFRELLQYLEQNQQVSMLSDADNNFKKVLLLSATSYFEYVITELLINFVKTKTNNNTYIFSFIKIKGIDRQYYTYFEWKDNNINKFFSLFGKDFKDDFKKKIEDDPRLDASIRAFIELGRLRNELVHENFASYPLNKTAEEIYNLYKESLLLIELLSEKLS